MEINKAEYVLFSNFLQTIFSRNICQKEEEENNNMSVTNLDI